MAEKTYKTGEVAKLAGITIRTLRYYDSINLLKPSKVLRNGHRQYNNEDIEKLQLIIGLKLLDFSLVDIKEYISKPNIDLMSILDYQDDMIQRKISLYKDIRDKIALIKEHFKDENRNVKDIFSMYEMIQMVKHNEIAKKYITDDWDESKLESMHEQEDYHDDLNKSLVLLAQDASKLNDEDVLFIKNTFIGFINTYFNGVNEETIGKTTLMLTEMTKKDTLTNNLRLEEIDLYNWLTDNLIWRK